MAGCNTRMMYDQLAFKEKVEESKKPGTYRLYEQQNQHASTCFAANGPRSTRFHASNEIPNIYHNLGLKKKILKSHISIDLGAKEFCISLAKILGQSYFYSNFSRLVIDPNRSLDSDQLIVKRSCGIEIPGNIKISSKEVKCICKYTIIIL